MPRSQLLFLTTIFALLQCELASSQDVRRAEPAVHIIVDHGKTGTGSIIKVDEETRTVYILTANHVIEGLEEVRVKFYIEGGTGEQIIEAIAMVKPEWVDDRKENDFAVIYVKDYPQNLSLPVIYIDDSLEERNQNPVWTIGYDEFGYLLTPSGNIGALKPTLRYGAEFVRRGFSGGPVLNRENFMIGMNLELDEKNREIFAVRASVFKPVVDSWIGLPRMQLELSVDDPPGAEDGVVSADQEFHIEALAREDKTGNLVAPKVEVTLGLPEGYRVMQGLQTMMVSINKEGSWKIKAPDEPKPELSITMKTNPEARSPLEFINMITVKGAELRPEITEPESKGLTLFAGEGVGVQAMVKNTGDAKLKESGSLKISFQAHEFDLVDSYTGEQPFIVDETVEWKLKARSETASASIWIEIISPVMDENDVPARIIGPSDSISVEIKPSDDGVFMGIPIILIADDVSVEVELGVRKRLFNIRRKGIPLFSSMSAGFGFDRINEGIDAAQEDEDVFRVFGKKHALLTLSLAVTFGNVSLQAGGGPGFYFADSDFNAWHMATGVELDLGSFSIQGGIRHVFHDDSELGGTYYLIQMKF